MIFQLIIPICGFPRISYTVLTQTKQLINFCSVLNQLLQEEVGLPLTGEGLELTTSEDVGTTAAVGLMSETITETGVISPVEVGAQLAVATVTNEEEVEPEVALAIQVDKT